MKALIDTTTYKVPTANFGLHTKEPFVYFIDVPINLELQRFLCPVDLDEFNNYMELVLKLTTDEICERCGFDTTQIVNEEMAKFLNEKSKDWYPVDENNEPIFGLTEISNI